MRAGWLPAFAASAIHHGETGNFGMLEAIEDQAEFAASLRTIENWLRRRGSENAHLVCSVGA